MPPAEWQRVCLLPASFHVSETGDVKLIDPPNRRLRRGKVSGHPVVKLGSHTIFIADLLARAFLASKTGFITFANGDPTDLRVENIVIVDDPDADVAALAAMMGRPREPLPSRRDGSW